MQCPICDYDWPDGTPNCLRCYYDFANRDARLAISRLRRSNIAGNVMWLAGTGLLFLSLVAIVGFVGFTTGAWFLFGTGSLGVTLATLGLIRADASKKQLVHAKQRTQLPPARVL